MTDPDLMQEVMRELEREARRASGGEEEIRKTT